MPTVPTPARVPTVAALGTLLAFALLLRGLGLDTGYWLDEAITLRTVTAPTLPDALRSLVVEQAPPSYFLALRLWALASTAEWWLRLFSVVPATFALIALALALERLRPTAGIVALLLMVAHPLLLRHAVEIRPYAWLLAWQAVVVGAAISVLNRPRDRKNALALGTGLVAAGLTHTTGMLLVPATAAWLAVASPAPRTLMTRPLAAALAAGAVVPLAAAFAQAQWTWQPASTWWMPSLTGSLAAHLGAHVAGLTPLSWPLTPETTVPWSLTLALWSALALTCAGVRSRDALAFGAAAITIAFGLTAFSLLVRPVLLPRSLLLVVPLVACGVGLAVASLESRVRRKTASILALGLAVIWSASWTGGPAGRASEPWPVVASVLAGSWQPHDAVLIAPHYAAVAVTANLAATSPITLGGVRLHQNETTGRSLPAPRGREPSPSRLFLVFRVDLSLRTDASAVDDMLAVAAAWAVRGHAVDVLVLTGVDVHFVPSLDDDAARIVDRTTRLWPDARRTRPHRQLTIISHPGTFAR